MDYLSAPRMSGFKQLKQWLDGLPDQVVGSQAAVCETGELYIEFTESSLCRPADIDVLEAHIANRMAYRLSRYLEGKRGRIYWRCPLEFDVTDHPQVVRYDENGPDRDFLTDKKCILDKDWKGVSLYCRLYRAKHQCASEEAKAA